MERAKTSWSRLQIPEYSLLRQVDVPWTLEFRRRNSNVQPRYSKVGFPSPTLEFRGKGTDYYCNFFPFLALQ